MPVSRRPTVRARGFATHREYHVEATAFLYEIIRVADCLREAQAFDGEPALKVSQAGLVELFTAPDDRRVVQVALTPAGRRELERQRMPTLAWAFTLLNGLEPSVMRSTNHVLHVMRQRLERYHREMRRAAR